MNDCIIIVHKSWSTLIAAAPTIKSISILIEDVKVSESWREC